MRGVTSPRSAGLALSAAVFLGGFAGLYLALKGLATLLTLGWGSQAFFLLGVIFFLVSAVSFSFLYLVRELMIGRGFKACLLGASLMGLGVLGVLNGDLPAFVTLEAAGAVLLAGLAGVSGRVVVWGRGGVNLRKSPVLLLALAVAVLGAGILTLTYVVPAALGYGGMPLFEGVKAYVPSSLGYREVSVGDVLSSVTVNGPHVILGLRTGASVRGVVEEVVKETVRAATRLGEAVLNLPGLERRGVSVSVISPPIPASTARSPSLQGPATSLKPRAPPLALYLLAKLSATLNTLLGRLSFINLVSLLFSLILIIYGLSVARGGGCG